MRNHTVALAGSLGLVALGLGAVPACSGTASQVKIGPPPARVTTGPLAGPLCTDDQCTCRKGADDAGMPEGGRKRFELRLASAQELWVTLPGHQLYKSPERAEACFYIDLAPGKHPVTLRASNKDGVSAALEVHELGVAAKSWYDTFKFACGHPGVCSFEELDGIKATYAGIPRNLHDVCGSTRIKSIQWDHGKAPDGLHPSELVVGLTLDIYKFMPDKPRGDTTCGAGEGRRQNTSDADADPGGGDDDGAPAE
ncbi:MAG: hypothetical protein H0T89_22160 [Deltaproteobacteria bacterium]|nr:hypothetical protein [Deltaproteobacteria bacterium]